VTVALVTGGLGFVGAHLCGLLRDRGWEVVVVTRRTVGGPPGVRLVSLDVTDPQLVDDAIAEIRPDVTFHLAAAMAQRGTPAEAILSNAVVGTLNVCSSLRRRGRPGSRLILAGSSAQYGDVPRAENPVAEDAPQRPVNAYGFAKVAAEAVACALAADGSLDVIPVRAFNHVGPGESGTTVAGAFALRISDVLRGAASRVDAGGLDAVRDFTDVRDIAAGYLAAAERGRPGRAYNLCSGRATSIGTILDGLLREAGVDRSIVDEVPTERGGIPFQVGSPIRARDELGWEARIPLDQSLADLLAATALRGA
jgi:GDP-4-dehydro-6-deoxy-D-mannose reductase